MPANPDNAAPATQAAGSSFYAGMRLLPKPEREAMYAIYGFCRAVDDIADDVRETRGARAAALDAWRRDIDAMFEGVERARTAVLLPKMRLYALNKSDFRAVIDGMAMDVERDIRAPDLATLDLYCDRVASAVGRLSVKIFGMDAAPGLKLAHHLGRALQLTNILRDLDEDAEVGRLYLPREFLDEAQISSREPRIALAHPSIDVACRKLAALAETHYREAQTVMAARPKGLLAAPRLMAAVYARMLARMRRAGWGIPRRRMRLSKIELLWIVLRHGLIG